MCVLDSHDACQSGKSFQRMGLSFSKQHTEHLEWMLRSSVMFRASNKMDHGFVTFIPALTKAQKFMLGFSS